MRIIPAVVAASVEVNFRINDQPESRRDPDASKENPTNEDSKFA